MVNSYQTVEPYKYAMILKVCRKFAGMYSMYDTTEVSTNLSLSAVNTDSVILR